MANWPHLKRAPITEALIDIRVKLANGTTVDDLERIRETLSDTYPECRQRKKWHTDISFSDDHPPVVHTDVNEPDGYLLSNPANTQVVQARLDGFTFSRLHPYETWERLRDDARTLWKCYCDVASPESVTRVAVRCINRIEIPLPVEDLRDWIKTIPVVADKLPQAIAGFFLRLNMPFENPKAFVNITQKVDPEQTGKHIVFLFDIDAFLPGSWSPSDSDIWQRLDELHERRNEVFFESLTDRATELFQ